jgi:cbb3-type cytochrome oxidase maturation protein
MNLILFMVSIAGALSFIFVVAYLWSVSAGQMDDLETPAHRILKNDSKIKILKDSKRMFE